ncbi:MAG: RidA family protein [Planctomycetota bacterium]|nr:RidA family protein [Planctomycetota bacterium]
MKAEQKLQKLKIELPESAAPVGAYVPSVRTGNLIFTAGQLPIKDGQLIATGKVAGEATLEQAKAAARQACLNALSVVRAETGSLDAVARIVRLNVFVNSAAGFTDQAKIANGASELLVEIFGESGKHTRCAIGAAELPLNASVELDLIVEV